MLLASQTQIVTMPSSGKAPVERTGPSAVVRVIILDIIKEENKIYLFSGMGLITLGLPLFLDHLYAIIIIRLYSSFKATLKKSSHYRTTPTEA